MTILTTRPELDDLVGNGSETFKWVVIRNTKEGYELARAADVDSAQILIQKVQDRRLRMLIDNWIYFPEKSELKVFLPELSRDSEGSFDSRLAADYIINNQGNFYASEGYLDGSNGNRSLDEMIRAYISLIKAHAHPLYSSLIGNYGPRFFEQLERQLDEGEPITLKKLNASGIKHLQINF